MSICLKLTCAGGHQQIIRTEGMTREWVEEWGRLMDGTSRMYVRPIQPNEVTSIGRCARCNCSVKSEVIDCEQGDQLAVETPRTTMLYAQDMGGIDEEDD